MLSDGLINVKTKQWAAEVSDSLFGFFTVKHLPQAPFYGVDLFAVFTAIAAHRQMDMHTQSLLERERGFIVLLGKQAGDLFAVSHGVILD